MENKELYTRILKNALLVLLVFALIAGIVMKDIMHVWAVFYGGILSILGFLSIVYMVDNASLEGNVKARFTSAYVFRYLIYFACMFIGAKLGLNIVSMLIGFLCINISIKINAIIERKEEN